MPLVHFIGWRHYAGADYRNKYDALSLRARDIVDELKEELESMKIRDPGAVRLPDHNKRSLVH